MYLKIPLEIISYKKQQKNIAQFTFIKSHRVIPMLFVDQASFSADLRWLFFHRAKPFVYLQELDLVFSSVTNLYMIFEELCLKWTLVYFCVRLRIRHCITRCFVHEMNKDFLSSPPRRMHTGWDWQVCGSRSLKRKS